CKNGVWSDWSACAGEGVCALTYTRACGTGGMQACVGACQWGACTGQTCQGPSSQPCGNCGMETRVCDNGAWSDWSACGGEGLCLPPSTRACGNAGTQTCNASCQWNACSGQSCVGPASQTCGSCGNQTRSCDNGTWSAWSACTGEGACAPASSQSC